MRHEFAAVEFYISHHPLDVYVDSLSVLRVISINQLLSHLEVNRDGCTFTMAGVLMAKQEKTSKLGKKYAFLQVSDAHGVYEVVLFSELLNQFRSVLEPGKPFPFTLTGKIEGEQIRLSAQNIEPLDRILSQHVSCLDVQLKGPDQLQGLAHLLDKAPPGETVLRVHLPIPEQVLGENCRMILRLSQKIELSGDLKSALMALGG